MISLVPVLAAKDLWAAPRWAPRETEPVLRGLTLAVAGAERVALLGPNGSGKSTLLQALAGLTAPRRGTIVFCGNGSSGGALPVPGVGGVALVFQNPDNQFVTVSVEREIALGLELLGLPRAEVARRVGAALERFHLGALRRSSPQRLSGGERQRVAIAAMMAMNPAVLLLDEPTSFLDARGRDELRQALADLPGEVAVMNASQEVEEILSADRALLLAGGELAATGSPAQLLGREALLREAQLAPPPLLAVVGELRRRGLSLDAEIDAGITAERLAEALAAEMDLGEERRSDFEWRSHAARVSDPSRSGGATSGGATRVGDEADVLRARDLHLVYQDGTRDARPALSGVNVAVRRGEIVGLLGETGSGKSTLLTLLGGLLRPGRGEILLGGEPVAGDDDRHGVRVGGRVGLLFQFAEDQAIAATALEDVAYGPARRGLAREEALHRAEEALLGVGLDERLFRRPLGRLSFGERRLAALAGILVMEPDFLLVDEPTAGLDPISRAGVVRILEGLRADGCGVVVATHDVELAGEVAQRVVVLRRGQVAFEGPAWELLADDELLRLLSLCQPSLARLVVELRHRGFPLAWPRRLTPAAVVDALRIAQSKSSSSSSSSLNPRK